MGMVRPGSGVREMPRNRFAASSLALGIVCGLLGQTAVASAYDMSCLPPIDDCSYKWYLEPSLVPNGGEASTGVNSAGSYEFHWRPVALSFDETRGDIPPLDASSFLPCENKGNDGVNALGYSGGGG